MKSYPAGNNPSSPKSVIMIMKDYAAPLSAKEKGPFEGILLNFLGVVCYISSCFMFSYAILGGL